MSKQVECVPGFRATIRGFRYERRGVVKAEFPAIGRFIFREDGKDEDRTYLTEFWKISPDSDDCESK